MATLSSTRVGTSLTWSLQFATRSRSLALSFTLTERARHRRQTSHRNEHDRYFSTQPPRRQDAPATSNSYVRKTSTAAAPATTSTSRPRYAPSVPVARQPPPETSRNVAANPPQEPIRELASEGLADLPPVAPSVPADMNPEQVDWARSFHGLSSQSFSKEAQEILMSPIPIDDIEIKPDGILYLPEIKYRRILNRAFGPGGWGLAPRGETVVTAKCVTREYALLANGRLVSIARGEQDYFDSEGIPTATEGCKSNALMRCCKDLGVASELWDPRFIRKYMAEYAKEIWVEHQVTKKKKKMTMRKDDELRYPYKEVRGGGASGAFA